jgi:hypothetical protein
MKPSLPDDSLTPTRAFVVQLRENGGAGPQALRGRVEHVVTGQAVIFTSLTELAAFMENVIRGRDQHEDK